MQIRLLLTLVLMVIVVAFSLANARAVTFNYIFDSHQVSLALIIIVAALVGSIAGVISGVGRQLHLRGEVHKKDKELQELYRREKELVEEVKTLRETKARADKPAST